MTISRTSQNIQDLFNRIAGRYDFMNDLISLNLHKNIKAEAVKMLKIKQESKILDACCGTGDLAGLIKKKEPAAEVIGLDFSNEMLKIAKNKIASVNFIHSDITQTDFPAESFDIVTMAFGLRNIPNAEKALREIHRILKPDGQFLHLDFGEKNFLNAIFNIEAPILARIFYGQSEPYKYLVESKKIFLTPDELISDFEKCGFQFKTRKDFIFGALSAQVMQKT